MEVGAGFCDKEGEDGGVLTGISVGIVTGIGFVVGISVGVSATGVGAGVGVGSGVGIVTGETVVVDEPEPAPPPVPVCAARSTLTVALAETFPAVSVCVKVSVCGGLIAVSTHGIATENAPPLQVVVVGFVARLALAMETVAPVSQVPVANVLIVMICALAAGVVIVGADGAVVSIIMVLFEARFVAGTKLVIALRLASLIIPDTEDTVSPDEVSPAPTV